MSYVGEEYDPNSTDGISYSFPFSREKQNTHIFANIELKLFFMSILLRSSQTRLGDGVNKEVESRKKAGK